MVGALHSVQFFTMGLGFGRGGEHFTRTTIRRGIASGNTPGWHEKGVMETIFFTKLYGGNNPKLLNPKIKKPGFTRAHSDIR